MSSENEEQTFSKKLFGAPGATWFILLAGVAGVLYVLVHGHANDPVAFFAAMIYCMLAAAIICVIIHVASFTIGGHEQRQARKKAAREEREKFAEYRKQSH